MLKEVRMITVMHVQNRIFIGSVFQIGVSDTSILLHLPYSKERTCIFTGGTFKLRHEFLDSVEPYI